jgi:hypothetical protein
VTSLWGMIRNPEDPYIDSEDGERMEPHGAPWSIISLAAAIGMALVLYIVGIV